MQLQHTCALASALLFCVAPLCAQTNRPGARPPASDLVTRTGCPAPIPPATSNSVATAADFIELGRSTCAGACPAYTVRISGDGTVAWRGEKFVDRTGPAFAAIDPNDARALMQRVADRGFWPLCGRYTHGAADTGPTFTTTLSLAGVTKRVQDVGIAAPSWLREMDLEVDRVGDTHRWRHGEPATETFAADRLRVDTLSPKLGVPRLMRAAAATETAELSTAVANTALDLNQADSSGWTPLMYAAQAGPPEAVAILLNARADPSRRSNAGETALFAAVSSVDQPARKLRLLVSAGLDVNARDNRGATPLMAAVRYAMTPAVITTLLEMGADPTAHDTDGRTALSCLAEQERLNLQDRPVGQDRPKRDDAFLLQIRTLLSAASR